MSGRKSRAGIGRYRALKGASASGVVVALSITAGAGMWGYALFNIATRAL